MGRIYLKLNFSSNHKVESVPLFEISSLSIPRYYKKLKAKKYLKDYGNGI